MASSSPSQPVAFTALCFLLFNPWLIFQAVARSTQYNETSRCKGNLELGAAQAISQQTLQASRLPNDFRDLKPWGIRDGGNAVWRCGLSSKAVTSPRVMLRMLTQGSQPLPWLYGAAPLPQGQRCTSQPGHGAPGGPLHPGRISAMQEKKQNPSKASGGDELFIRLQPALAFRELA